MKATWRILAALLMIGLSVFNYISLPMKWRRRRFSRPVALGISLLGILSVLCMFFVFPHVRNGTLQKVILSFETLYALNLFLLDSVFILRVIVLFAAGRRHTVKKIRRTLNRERVSLVCFIVVGLVGVQGLYNIDHVILKEYDADISRGAVRGTMDIALISDTHVGAGARRLALSRMVGLSNGADPDVVLFAGDAADSASSLNDLEMLRDSLSAMQSRYGIYYVSGNHEKECLFDVAPYIADAGVNIIDGKSVRLPNGVFLVGVKDGEYEAAGEIMELAGITDEDTVILLQHRPLRPGENADMADLLLTGHTHGYRYPVHLISGLFRYNQYGMKTDRERGLVSITTSGVSAWGFHFKWPGKSEVALIHLTY